jgi:hypothetical protein
VIELCLHRDQALRLQLHQRLEDGETSLDGDS